LNGSNLGLSRSEASCLNYAKSCARGRKGFHEATLHASFTPKATSAAERLSRSEDSCLNYAKRFARGSE